MKNIKSIKDINNTYDAMGQLLQSLKQKGYFFTAMEACKCLGAIGDILKPKAILDPNCGVGEILYYCNYGDTKEAYSHDIESIKAAEDILENCSFYHKNFLEEKSSKKYDLVVSQFPPGPRRGKDGEEFYPDTAYVEKSLGALEKDGALLAIVPEVFLNEKYNEALRKAILDKYSLEMVVHLPKELMPELKRNTAIILIKNSPQRAKVYIDQYKENIEEIITNYQERSGELWVSAEELIKRWDFHYHYYSPEEIEDYFKGRHYKYLKDMATISLGVLITPKMLKPQGNYRVFDGNHIKEGKMITEGKDIYYTDRVGEDFILQDGDIVVNLYLDTDVKVYQYKKSDPPTMVGAKYAIIRSKDNPYIASYLSTKVEGEEIFLKQLYRLMKGTLPKVSTEDLGNVKVPILTDGDLNNLTPEGVKKVKSQQKQKFLENIMKFAEMIDIMQSKKIAQQTQGAFAPIIEELSFGINVLKNLQKSQEEVTNNLDKEKNEKLDKILNYVVEVANNMNKVEGTLHRRIDEMEGSMEDRFQNVDSNLKEIKGDTKEMKGDVKEVKNDIKTMMHMLEELDKELKVLRKETEERLKSIQDEWSREEIYKDFSDKLWDAFERKYEKKEDNHYHAIKNMLIDKFGKENWEKLDSDSRIYLITARVVYENLEKYNSTNNPLDFSPPCIALTKALERELYIHIFEKMSNYFKYLGPNLPDGLIEGQGNNLRFKKSHKFSLGSVPYLVGTKFNENKKDSPEEKKAKEDAKTQSILRFFKKMPFKDNIFRNTKELSEYLDKFGNEIDFITTKYRNKAAHKNKIDIKTAEKCYEILILEEKVLIEFIKKIK